MSFNKVCLTTWFLRRVFLKPFRGFEAKTLLSLLMVALLYLTFLSSQNALAAGLAASQSEMWQPILQVLPKDKGVFNANLRQQVRNHLDLSLATGEDSNQSDEQLEKNLVARLSVLDKNLSKYIRVSESSSRFEQLKRLMPALYKIEERKLIEKLLKKRAVKIPNLRNRRLLAFLDKN